MVNKLIPFLKDMIGRVQPFAQVISHVHLKENEDGTLLAVAPATDGSLQITATSKEPLSLGGARACIGNIPYLHLLLQSNLMTDKAALAVNTGEARNGKLIVRSMTFRLNDRTEVQYVTADPLRESIMKPTAVGIDEWPVLFEIDDQTMSELSELKKINAAIPIGSGDQLVQIAHTDGKINVEFDSDSHSSTIDLNVVVDSQTKKNFSIHVAAGPLMQMLKMAQSKNGNAIIGQLADKALRINVETEVAQHEMTLIRRRIRD